MLESVVQKISDSWIRKAKRNMEIIEGIEKTQGELTIQDFARYYKAKGILYNILMLYENLRQNMNLAREYRKKYKKALMIWRETRY